MTQSEENYLKSLFYLSDTSKFGISTNSIAEKMDTKASSVTDMIKKLAEKKLVNYQKYKGVTLTKKGLLEAKMIVRKHRLWEFFLVKKLYFSWDEVHEIAEELEHIKSEKLIDRLDEFLGFPTKDPHGDAIPNKDGKILETKKTVLADLEPNFEGICVGVKDSSAVFLQYLNKQKISLGTQIKVIERELFDKSLTIEVAGIAVLISNQIASSIVIKKI